MKRRHSDSELSDLLPHLFYEIRMLLMTDLLLLRERQAPRDPADFEDWTIHNALIESHTVHARALYAFFFLEPSRPDDAVASDYAAAWPEHRPNASDILKTVAPRVGKEIAHLTFGRLAYRDDAARQWSFTTITGQLIDVINLWLDNSPEQIRQPLLDYLGEYAKQAELVRTTEQ